MTDGIIRGSGNSRYLRTVANARTLYPTYSDFLTALIQGTFPIDLNGINSSGWSTVGMKLNKANLLTDSLCSALGLSTSATPNQAMDKLRQLIATAQAGVDNGVKIELVSYVGTGTNGVNNPTSVTFPFAPKIMCLTNYQNIREGANYTNYTPSDWINPILLTTDYQRGILNSNATIWAKISSDRKTLTWYSTESFMVQWNSPTNRYDWLAIK
ncbi:hypothetical protein D1641_01300 [Colidextribacter sp. OB.20]|uniref:hypothetical protein n=1 Tax=Colidextribacter sp. OB.20 TaxID=2304568 RepID=UPI00137195CF|nr:hypothetical protein [Colidextribacter sp. OB.20]NBI08656.1 hypothetical protein [Colidextribacter sp. OB.20]